MKTRSIKESVLGHSKNNQLVVTATQILSTEAFRDQRNTSDSLGDFQKPFQSFKQSGCVDPVVKAKLEDGLHFKPYYEVQEVRRKASREICSHEDLDATDLKATKAFNEAKKKLEGSLAFKDHEEVEELQRRLTADMLSRRRSDLETPKTRLEKDLRFKGWRDIQTDRARVIAGQGNMEDLKKKLEHQLHFKDLGEVEEDRRRLEIVTGEDREQLKKKLEKCLHFKSAAEVQKQREQLKMTDQEAVRKRLEKKLHFKNQAQVQQDRERLICGTTERISPVRHKLEETLNFKSKQEVEQTRKKLQAPSSSSMKNLQQCKGDVGDDL